MIIETTYHPEDHITYSSHPFLFFFSQDCETRVSELPFNTLSDEDSKFLDSSEGFAQMFSFVFAMNSHKKKDATTNYFYVPNTTLDIYNLLGDFLNSEKQTQYGLFLLPNGGQYAYIVMDKLATREIKKMENANYICAAVFQGNGFLAFEEGFVFHDGIDPTHGYFSKGKAKGDFLVLVSALLALAQKKQPLKLFKSKKVKEKIYCLSKQSA
ncbi:MAG: hypothetical protein FWH36_07185 [Lentimicrobiaceae bacterium]|nr:hypothetical protein [Lentimicrobiaceae bacterium]